MIRSISLLRRTNACFVSRHFSSTDGLDKDPLDRGEQAKGAMKKFLNQKKTEGANSGLFAQLRSTVAPPTSNDTVSETSSEPSSQDGLSARPSAPRPRAMNKRFPAKKSPGGTFGGAGDGDGAESTFMGNRNGRNRRRGKDDDIEPKDVMGSSSADDKVPDQIASQLLDHKYFEDLAARGRLPHILDTSSMDPIDELLAMTWLESFKSKSHTFQAVLDEDMHRVQLPSPRSMHDIMWAMQPKINSAEKGTEAYEIAEKAWGVISKNIYFTPEQQYALTEGIARTSNRMIMNAMHCQDKEFDLILHPEFKRGADYIEEERRLMMLRDEPIDELYEQEDTDWEVDAVEDEDQL